MVKIYEKLKEVTNEKTQWYKYRINNFSIFNNMLCIIYTNKK
jgi:hypothetical protein